MVKTKKARDLILKWSFVFIPVVYIAFRVATHTGYKELYGSYFFNAIWFLVILAALTTKKFESYFKKSVIGVGMIIFLTEVFWSYMDYPWFAGPETNTCDGPCFGWFSFENDSPSILLVFFSSFLIIMVWVLKMPLDYILRFLKRLVSQAKSNSDTI